MNSIIKIIFRAFKLILIMIVLTGIIYPLCITGVSKIFFNMGNPLDMKAPVCIDLVKLSERSSGIFGKSGTGKTFLTRLCKERLDPHIFSRVIRLPVLSKYSYIVSPISIATKKSCN